MLLCVYYNKKKEKKHRSNISIDFKTKKKNKITQKGIWIVDVLKTNLKKAYKSCIYKLNITLVTQCNSYNVFLK